MGGGGGRGQGVYEADSLCQIKQWKLGVGLNKRASREAASGQKITFCRDTTCSLQNSTARELGDNGSRCTRFYIID